LFDLERMYSPDKSTVVAIARQHRQRAADTRHDIFDSHRHRAFALAYYMTGNEIEAEKILTNTFVAAFSATPEPTGPDVDAALVSELRERFPLDAQVTPATPEYAAAGAPDLSQRNILRTDLEQGIQTLPAQERLVFLLRDVEGYTPAAIAQLLQMTETQVNRTLMSARIRLRRALAEGKTHGLEAA
jgi:RNA polymerase sigma-70 factor (ECF subfamily)